MYLENSLIRELFTPENIEKRIENENKDVLYCAFDSEYKENIIVLVQEKKELFRLMNYHIDAFKRDSETLEIDDYNCIGETFLTKSTVKSLMNTLDLVL